MLNRKMHTIKKGGYTLFSDIMRNMLLVAGMSLLSVCTLTSVVSAQPTQEGHAYRKDCGTYSLYQISAKEELNNEYKLENILVNGQEVEETDKVFWKISSDGKELLAVIKVVEPDEEDTLEIKVINSDKREATAEEIAEGWTNKCTIENVQDYDIEHEEGPKIKWKYKNKEENYVKFEAEDDIVISELVSELVDGKEWTVNIEEKDKGTDVVAKYVLKEGDTKFSVRNIFGKSCDVEVADIGMTYTIAAKNTDGQRVVLNISLPEGAKLQSLTTVENKDILLEATKELKGGEEDDLVAIYTNVPEGTTYLDLKYRPEGGADDGKDDEIIPIALKLDLKEPEVVQRDEEGNIVDGNGTARVYKNGLHTKALVEVKDMTSGIVKIAVYKDAYECTGATQKFDIKNLPTSVLQLMDLPEGATNIKIFDGMDNVHDIRLDDILIDDGSGLSLTMSEDNDTITATYNDNKSGLHKFVRANEDRALAREAIKDYEKNFAPRKNNADDLYQSIQTKNDIQEKYQVKEQSVTLQKKDWQGVPEFTVLNVLGNKKEFNINDIMFKVDKIYMATSGDEDPVVRAMAVKVHDARRIKKITADINGEEKTLDTFETGILVGTETGDDIIWGPTDIDRVYEFPDGSHVTKVTFYHYNGDVTQNEIDVDFEVEDEEEDSPIVQIPEVQEPSGEEPSGEEPGEDPREEFVDIIVGGGEMPGVDGAPTINIITKIKYGIRKIEYSDGCVIEFYEDLPKEVEVYTKDSDGNPLESVIITDGLGYTYNVADGSGDIAKFSPEG